MFVEQSRERESDFDCHLFLFDCYLPYCSQRSLIVIFSFDSLSLSLSLSLPYQFQKTNAERERERKKEKSNPQIAKPVKYSNEKIGFDSIIFDDTLLFQSFFFFSLNFTDFSHISLPLSHLNFLAFIMIAYQDNDPYLECDNFMKNE